VEVRKALALRMVVLGPVVFVLERIAGTLSLLHGPVAKRRAHVVHMVVLVLVVVVQDRIVRTFHPLLGLVVRRRGHVVHMVAKPTTPRDHATAAPKSAQSITRFHVEDPSHVLGAAGSADVPALDYTTASRTSVQDVDPPRVLAEVLDAARVPVLHLMRVEVKVARCHVAVEDAHTGRFCRPVAL
jgi:hypothetical protein